MSLLSLSFKEMVMEYERNLRQECNSSIKVEDYWSEQCVKVEEENSDEQRRIKIVQVSVSNEIVRITKAEDDELLDVEGVTDIAQKELAGISANVYW